MTINLKEFPITRYQGSKRKIVPWIYSTLIELDLKYETVLDGFCGTSSVGYMFKKIGKTVTCNDVLRFNYLIGRAIIENSTELLSEDEVDTLLGHKALKHIVQRHFGDFYYLDEENAWIDNVAAGIYESAELSDYKKAIALYSLFQSCLIKRPFNLFHRKNLTLRTNDVPRNFGNKTSWDRDFSELFRKFSKEANNLIFDNKKECVSLNQSIFSLDAEQYDLVYLDPPYFTKKHQETSNYFKCYHFLEGLAKYNDWERLIDEKSFIKKLQDNDVSNEFNAKNITEKLEELFIKFRKSTIILSYKEHGIPSINHVVDVLTKLNKIVIVKSVHYKYALNQQNGDASQNREVLIIAK